MPGFIHRLNNGGGTHRGKQKGRKPPGYPYLSPHFHSSSGLLVNHSRGTPLARIARDFLTPKSRNRFYPHRLPMLPNFLLETWVPLSSFVPLQPPPHHCPAWYQAFVIFLLTSHSLLSGPLPSFPHTVARVRPDIGAPLPQRQHANLQSL